MYFFDLLRGLFGRPWYYAKCDIIHRFCGFCRVRFHYWNAGRLLLTTDHQALRLCWDSGQPCCPRRHSFCRWHKCSHFRPSGHIRTAGLQLENCHLRPNFDYCWWRSRILHFGRTWGSFFSHLQVANLGPAPAATANVVIKLNRLTFTPTLFFTGSLSSSCTLQDQTPVANASVTCDLLSVTTDYANGKPLPPCSYEPGNGILSVIVDSDTPAGDIITANVSVSGTSAGSGVESDFSNDDAYQVTTITVASTLVLSSFVVPVAPSLLLLESTGEMSFIVLNSGPSTNFNSVGPSSPILRLGTEPHRQRVSRVDHGSASHAASPDTGVHTRFVSASGPEAPVIRFSFGQVHTHKQLRHVLCRRQRHTQQRDVHFWQHWRVQGRSRACILTLREPICLCKSRRTQLRPFFRQE